jgi:hypothetical protein
VLRDETLAEQARFSPLELFQIQDALPSSNIASGTNAIYRKKHANASNAEKIAAIATQNCCVGI